VSVVVMFFAILAALAGWWLARQRLFAKPWLEQGVIDDGVPEFRLSHDPAKRVGLGFLLAVIGSLFMLVIGAWFMRRDLGDWQPVPVPGILWINTGALVLSSLVLEWSQRAVRRDSIGAVRTGLAIAAVFALAFIGGQLFAWQQLAASGFVVAGNPANSFFYLVTGLHGLHILGGLVALGWAAIKASRATDTRTVRLNVELCATYWLFMLFVWVVLFSLIAGWAGRFVDFCMELLS
jgi:cytochrome c oxidase subunit III